MIKFFFSFLMLSTCLGYAATESVQIEQQIIESVDNLAHVDAEKMQLEQKVKDLESKIRERKKVINQRARALSYLQRFQWGGLLSSDEPYLIERNLKVVDRLNKYDIAIFKEYKISLKSLASARINLVDTQKQLQAIVANLQSQQSELSTADNQRKQSLVATNENSLLKMKGELTRPLVGLITLPFGSRPDKQNQYVLVSKGLLFKTEPGQAVQAVGPGVLIFRDHLAHWRETLIVRHDDNYYSVYAGIMKNQKSELKKVQSSVEKDEVLGFTSGTEFYFELRHFENPINPALWFKESL
ncbi:MAG: peptidoglycan DD-metalloendopeptidase family protein [Bdellovibrio sp.]|nr:peptidoglycan DD-metalloendopeptidase family protein [Bdellovibrio sp.]